MRRISRDPIVVIAPPTSPDRCDVCIIGAGPAGSVAALELARGGLDVMVLDRSEFPRFRIGESMLPHAQRIMEELGLMGRVRAMPHVEKKGLELTFGDGRREPMAIAFDEMMGDGVKRTFNIRRSIFDRMLADAAAEAGARFRFGESVTGFDGLDHGDVRVRVGGRTIHADWLIDASGQACVLARHLGTRRFLPGFKNVSYFEHFEGCHRNTGEREGFATLAMCREGWFWMIALDETTTSIGVVLDNELARRIPAATTDRLRWCVDRCPAMSERMRDATGPDRNQVAGDFSYTCDRHADDGWFMIGDAAAFIDPVWSTGVTLGLDGGVAAARAILDVARGDVRPRSATDRHHARIARLRSEFMGLIGNFYDHSFRELIVSGRGPFQVHRAVVNMLAGEVFGGVPFGVRWRWELMKWFREINRFHPLNERIRPHSILQAGGVELPSPRSGVCRGVPRRKIGRPAWQSA